jgi:hypothetical protein
MACESLDIAAGASAHQRIRHANQANVKDGLKLLVVLH